jgi:site-specific DNA-cytosine methylase
MLKTIDLFSGVGGMSYGFEMAGFQSLLAVEKEPNIAKTYQLNFPHSKVVNEDVTNLKISESLCEYGWKNRCGVWWTTMPRLFSKR